MGCIQSKSAGTQSPIRTHAPEQTNLLSTPLQQRRLQNILFTVSGTPNDWRIFSQLQALHAQAMTLLEHIEIYHTNEPALNEIYIAATELYNDLGERTLYFEGDSPSRYQARLDAISQTVEANMPPFQYAQSSLLTSPEVGPNMSHSLSSSPRTRPQTPSPR